MARYGKTNTNKTRLPEVDLKSAFLPPSDPVGLYRVKRSEPMEGDVDLESLQEELMGLVNAEFNLKLESNLEDAMRYRDSKIDYDPDFSLNIGAIKTLPGEFVDVCLEEVKQACETEDIDEVISVLDTWVFTAGVRRHQAFTTKLMEIIQKAKVQG